MTDSRFAPGPAGAVLTVDLAALAANWRDLAARVAPAACAAVVKADAYGLGIAEAVPALAAAGCRSFFVAVPEEGVRVRHAAPTATVHVLNGFFADAAATYRDHDLRPVLGSPAEVEAWIAATADAPRPSALHVDTGMNRLGLSLAEALALAADPSRIAAAGIALVMSHLACADEPDHPLTADQAKRFSTVRAAFAALPASLANSAGVFRDAALHFDLVRPGVALYGGAVETGAPPPLRPVVRLDARILQIRDVAPGDSVGYGASQRLPRGGRIAILSTGYADGYHRLASASDTRAGGRGFLHGRAAPIVGRVSMDLTAVDVGAIPEARPGDPVELIGPNVALADVARAMGTIDYEVLTSLGRRYRRVYEGG